MLGYYLRRQPSIYPYWSSSRVCWEYHNISHWVWSIVAKTLFATARTLLLLWLVASSAARIPQQTQDFHTRLVHCWPTIGAAGLTMNQPRMKCPLGLFFRDYLTWDHTAFRVCTFLSFPWIECTPGHQLEFGFHSSCFNFVPAIFPYL